MRFVWAKNEPPCFLSQFHSELFSWFPVYRAFWSLFFHSALSISTICIFILLSIHNQHHLCTRTTHPLFSPSFPLALLFDLFYTRAHAHTRTVKETTAAVSVLEDSVENTRSELQSVTTALQKSRNAVQGLNEARVEKELKQEQLRERLEATRQRLEAETQKAQSLEERAAQV